MPQLGGRACRTAPQSRHAVLGSPPDRSSVTTRRAVCAQIRPKKRHTVHRWPARAKSGGLVERTSCASRGVQRARGDATSRREPMHIGRARLVFPYPPDPAELTLPLVEQVCESLGMPSTERSPQRCPNGHPLAANTCLVGWEVCGCTTAHNGGHRTHYCRRCGETIRTPECVGAEPQRSRWTSAREEHKSIS